MQKMTLNSLERTILAAIQHGLPLSRWPYQELSQRVGIPVGQLLETLGHWKAEGKIRRIGAIVNHFQLGQGAGAMVVWNVPEDEIDKIGALFASFPQVSHAYQRPSAPAWPFTLYTMVHASKPEDLMAVLEAMSNESRISDYRVLRTLRELKKVPPTYI